MHIVHIITGLNTGGAEMMLCKLIANDKSPTNHTVVSLTGKGTLSKAVSEYAAVHHFHLKKPLDLCRLLLFALKRASTFDVCIGWMYHGALVAQLLFTRCPVIWNIRHSLHDLRLEKSGLRFVIAILSRLSNRPARIFYNSQTAMSQHEQLGFSARAGTYMPNGFDAARYHVSPDLRAKFRGELGVSADMTLIGTVGRFHPMKNHLGFVATAAEFLSICDDPQKYKFVLVGRGLTEGNASVMAEIRRHGLNQFFILLGQRDDIPAVLNGLDLFCLPSLWGEGFPNILGEAMLCGALCSATNVGDSGIILADDRFTAVPFSPVTLAKIWHHQIDLNPTQKQEVKAAARKKIVEQFGIEQIVAAYQHEFLSLAQQASGKSRD